MEGMREYLHLDGWTEEEKKARKREQNRRAVRRYRERNREELNAKRRKDYKKEKINDGL